MEQLSPSMGFLVCLHGLCRLRCHGVGYIVNRNRRLRHQKPTDSSVIELPSIIEVVAVQVMHHLQCQSKLRWQVRLMDSPASNLAYRHTAGMPRRTARISKDMRWHHQTACRPLRPDFAKRFHVDRGSRLCGNAVRAGPEPGALEGMGGTLWDPVPLSAWTASPVYDIQLTFWEYWATIKTSWKLYIPRATS